MLAVVAFVAVVILIALADHKITKSRKRWEEEDD